VDFDNVDDGENRPRAVGFGRTREPMMGKKKRPEYRRKGAAPQNSGMCLRTNKKWTWGSGRAARILDAHGRTFSGCLALLLVAAASACYAAPVLYVDMTVVGDPGNTARAGNGFGTVGYYYKMANTETTNSQYAEFLNNSRAGREGLYGVYNNNAATTPGSAYMIRRDGTAGSYTYSVTGTGNNHKPINWVSWFSAARFANWLSNGADLSADTETGSYTLLGGQTSGNIATRNHGAVYYLPSMDEWTKAAFYNAAASTYLAYPSISSVDPMKNGTLPAIGNASTARDAFAANYGGDSSGSVSVLPVANFTTVTSAYGMYDMLGNVNEMTDTVSPTEPEKYAQVSGSYQTSINDISKFNSLTAPPYVLGATSNAPRGFRIAAVPEPSSVALAGTAGALGFIGNWIRRRRHVASTALGC
jgi:formylglycine-generating enzyme required for sulfatase activity